MTDEVEAAAVALIEQVDSLGGAVHAIEVGDRALDELRKAAKDRRSKRAVPDEKGAGRPRHRG